MTITEFLLARIAEDEADEGMYAHTYACASNRHPYPDSWDCGDCNCGADDRHMAECEAKRRIVERFGTKYPHPEEGCDDSCFGDPAEHWAAVDAAATAVDLASVYADHPDYDPEWTPRA